MGWVRALPEPAPFCWAGEVSRALAMLGGLRAGFQSMQRVIKPAQLQLVRQAWTGGFGGVWTLQKRGNQCCRLCGAVPRGQGGSGSWEGPG